MQIALQPSNLYLWLIVSSSIIIIIIDLVTGKSGVRVQLKQLEEKQRLQVVPESYFSRDLYRPAESTSFSQQCRPLSSALQEVHFKGTLMDRLRLLETRILQVR